MKHPAAIWITTAIACILLIACRTNKEVAASANTATVQPDTAHWQLVYPKTKKTEGDLWRQGNVYALDTNDVKFHRVDTNSIQVFYTNLHESGGTYTELSPGMSFPAFIDSLERNKEVERVNYHIQFVKLKDKTKKHQEELYKSRNQYYAFGRIFLGYPINGKVESGRLDVYYSGDHEKERINIPDNMLLEEYIRILEADSKVDSIWTVNAEEDMDEDEYLETNGISSDSARDKQWGLERIYAQDAWDITMGDSNLVVAVLEFEGIDWSHYELGKGYDKYQNIYLNNGEDAWNEITDAAGRKTYNPQTGNGLDDDGDGLKDNFIGWNFKDNNKDCRTDSSIHGTAVAGIIAAKTNNGRGISGIAGGDSCAGVRILPYVMRKHFGLSLQDAARKNVRMVNMSFSLSSLNDSLNIYNAYIQNAVSHGILMVAASGNLQNPKNNVKYPARNPHVMAVGAINKKNERRPTSCYGSQLSVVAPGEDIYTTTKNDTFTSGSGTSFAAPHVTGVAALMLSVKPELTPGQVRRIIEKTARKVGGYNYHNDPQHPNGTWNEEMGYGLVDAHAAVLNAVDSTLDLYVRDAEGDDGSEPSVTTTPWNSPDIWIEDMNHREVTSLQGLTNYYVCVRIHNRTGHASTGYEKLYLNWVKAGPGSDWSAAWQGEKKLTGDGGSISLGYSIIGKNSRKGHPIPVISAGRDTVVRVRWRTPEPDYYSAFYNSSELRHFCLCARIHDGRRIENEDSDGINMGEFVKNSSHVAWKNIEIQRGAYYVLLKSPSGKVLDIKTLVKGE
ncbi:MAG: S8 family serine peptidase [Bacteroidales bacterium]|nr:S8 family serine peptidase [Bacteroidales bacterium]